MRRRDFFRFMAAGTVTAGTFLYSNPWNFKLKQAQAATGKTLIVIFQRGGCDGLNCVVPFADPEYYNLRPTIAIPHPDSGDPRATLPLNNFFGLHPSLAPLLEIFKAGDLAVMPTVHYPNGNRSHFDSEIIIESGARDKLLDGWLNRHLNHSSPTGNPHLRAIGFGNEIPHSLRGEAPVSIFNDISDFSFTSDSDSDNFRNRLRQVYEQPVDPDNNNRKSLHKQGLILFDNLDFLETLKPDDYEPENGAQYPNSNYGRQLMQTAMLIKQGVGLETATLDFGGWDTHSNQGGAQTGGYQARRLQEFASGIKALYSDLGGLMNDVVILTMTEFGRTARENGSGGTDHGNAAAWFAIGHPINGGIFGAWPGLNPENLYKGRYLSHTLDFRDIFAEIIGLHLNNPNLETVFPDYSCKPIGLL